MRYQHIFERVDQAVAIQGILQTGMYVDDRGSFTTINSDDEFEDYLYQNYDLVPVGSGVFSIVKAGAGGRDFVIKMSLSARRAVSDNWYSFAKVAQANTHNSLFPQILFAGDPAWRDEKKYGLLEFLEIREPSDHVVFDATMDLAHSWALGSIPDNPGVFEFLKNNHINAKEFREFVRLTDSLGSFDIHSGNIGWRKDGSAVIFDPVY
jgi:hypothetical protein